MDFEVTANRKRPKTLAELAGQEFVVSTLKSSIEANRIAHAFLFSGPRGVGKTSAARIFARSLNCEKGPTGEPCGVCSNCIEISKGVALDVIEIDGASNTGVNDIREIRDEVLFPPTSCKYKIYIIDEVHMLSNSAFNALLKTIEEPPPYIVFIFATTEIHKVPATIRSRCQQFNFRLISLETIKIKLVELCNEDQVQYEDDALLWIAKESTGSLRDAYTLFDQILSFSDGNITTAKIREKLGVVGIDQIDNLVKSLLKEKTSEILIQTDVILSTGISIEQFIVELAEYFRNILFLKNNIEKESILGYGKERFSEEVVKSFSNEQIIFGVDLILQVYKDLRYSLNQRFELELLIAKLGNLNRYLSKESIFNELRNLKEDLVSTDIPLNSTENTDGPEANPTEDNSNNNKHIENEEDKKKTPSNRVEATPPLQHISPEPQQTQPNATIADVEPTYVEPTRVEPAHVEPAHVEPAHVEPARVEPAHVEPARVEPAHVEPARVAQIMNDPLKDEFSDNEFQNEGLIDPVSILVIKDALLFEIRKENPLLHANLTNTQQPVEWFFDGDNLKIETAREYERNLILKKFADITAILKRIFSKQLSFSVICAKKPVSDEERKENEETQHQQYKEKIDIVKEVFNGEIIQGGV